MKFYYLDLVNVLRYAETKMSKNKETKEFFEDELKLIREMKNFLFNTDGLWFEIKSSNPF